MIVIDKEKVKIIFADFEKVGTTIVTEYQLAHTYWYRYLNPVERIEIMNTIKKAKKIETNQKRCILKLINIMKEQA